MRWRPSLLVVLTVAAMTFMASPASAEPLELVDEASDSSCPTVTVSGVDVEGGCLVHATSDGLVELRAHVFGVEVATASCNIEVHGRFDDEAEGEFFEQLFSGANCPYRACEDAPGEANPWPAVGTDVAGQPILTVQLCVEPTSGGADQPCELDLPLNPADEEGHSHELGGPTEVAGHGTAGFRCEVLGQWTTEVGGVQASDDEQGVVIVPQTLWLDSGFSVPAKSTLLRTAISFEKRPSSTMSLQAKFNNVTRTITCSNSHIGGTVYYNNQGTPRMTHIETEWALFAACTIPSGGGQADVVVEAKDRWGLRWSGFNAFRLYRVVIQTKVEETPKIVCEWQLTGSSHIAAGWVNGTPSSLTINGSPAVNGDCTGPVSVSLPYRVKNRTGGTGGNVWLQ